MRFAKKAGFEQITRGTLNDQQYDEAVGDLDSYVLRPWTEGDELFHRTVAELVSTGLSNKDVAAQCWVSPRTVAFHLRNIFTKAGVTSRGELAQLDVVDEVAWLPGGGANRAGSAASGGFIVTSVSSVRVSSSFSSTSCAAPTASAGVSTNRSWTAAQSPL